MSRANLHGACRHCNLQRCTFPPEHIDLLREPAMPPGVAEFFDDDSPRVFLKCDTPRERPGSGRTSPSSVSTGRPRRTQTKCLMTALAEASTGTAERPAVRLEAWRSPDCSSDEVVGALQNFGRFTRLARGPGASGPTGPLRTVGQVAGMRSRYRVHAGAGWGLAAVASSLLADLTGATVSRSDGNLGEQSSNPDNTLLVSGRLHP